MTLDELIVELEELRENGVPDDADIRIRSTTNYYDGNPVGRIEERWSLGMGTYVLVSD